jgi:hypothetical protein
MKKLLIAAAAGLLCWSMSATAFTWVGPVTILGYFLYGDGNDLYIRTSGDHQNPDNCQNSRYLSLDASSPRFKELFAIIVAAQATSSTVSVNYDGCRGPYPRIDSVAAPLVW